MNKRLYLWDGQREGHTVIQTGLYANQEKTYPDILFKLCQFLIVEIRGIS